MACEHGAECCGQAAAEADADAEKQQERAQRPQDVDGAQAVQQAGGDHNFAHIAGGKAQR
jgi:hypothetical protein